MHYLTERLITAGSGSMFATRWRGRRVDRAPRDALVRTVYARAFDWLVGRINTFVGGKHDADELASSTTSGCSTSSSSSASRTTRFEQLCINFANEKLQQLFLGCVFKAEAELYEAEGVPWKLIDFSDNQARRCIEHTHTQHTGTPKCACPRRRFLPFPVRPPPRLLRPDR